MAAHCVDPSPPSTWRGERGNRPGKNTVDLELGLAHQYGGYPPLSAYITHLDESMVFRRFGFLHARLLLHRQSEVRQLEQELEKSEKIEDSRHNSYGGYPVSRLTKTPDAQPGEATDPIQRRYLLLDEIEDKLSKYNSMLLQMQSLGQIATSSPRQGYFSVGQFLEQGPDIHMDRSEAHEASWPKYELAVKDFLRDKGLAFLKKPLNRIWMEEPYQGANKSRKPSKTFRVGVESRISQLIGVSMGLTMQSCLHIFFWIGHITAALGFVLVANSAGSDKSSTAAM